jgi:DNA transformation protein
MSVNEGFLEFVIGQLEGLDGVTSRKMFGGAGIFHEKKMFGLISESSFFLKVDDSNRDLYEKEKMEQFRPWPDKPMRMPYYEVPARVLEDREVLREWARVSIEIAHK